MERAAGWARECGRIQMEYFRTGRLHTRNKLNDSDIVTEADGRSEALLVERITSEFPGHSILGEETGRHEGSAEWRWVIDPLDGTTNLNAGLPSFAISIALEHNGESVVGVVYAPYLDEMFTAVKGGGARLNGKPIHCSGAADLAKAVVCTGFPVDKRTNADNNLDNFGRVMPLVRGERRLGAASVDLCYVAAGFLDAFWELHLHRWDVAAGLLIAREAGARAEALRASTEQDENVIACAPALFPSLRRLLS